MTDEGTHDELLSRGGIYADLYRLQFQDGKTVSDAKGLHALSAKDRATQPSKPGFIQRLGQRLFGNG